MIHLSNFPRVSLGFFPTPLESLSRLSSFSGFPNIYIKRDDCTGLAGGGNKVRKLEFLIADAVAQKADTIITQGAVQSNHVRQTIAAASKFGMKTRLILERRIANTDPSYESGGNILLDKLLGAESIRIVDGGTDMNLEMEKEAAMLKGQGRKPYIIVGGGSNAIGSLGYVKCAHELVKQAKDQNIKIDWLVHATGSSGTQAGLAVGLKALDSDIKLLGISVRQPEEVQVKRVYQEIEQTSKLMGITNIEDIKNIRVNSDYIEGGYGITGRATISAIHTLAETEGVLLDPVYTAKAMAGLLDLCRKGFFSPSENVVFLHTGGMPGIFAYEKEIYNYLSELHQKAA